MMTVSSRSPSSLNSSVDIETDTEYLKIAKKGGGRKGQKHIYYYVQSLYRVKPRKAESSFSGEYLILLVFDLTNVFVYLQIY